MVTKGVDKPEAQLLSAVKAKDVDKVRNILTENPLINLNCKDSDDFTPLQNACHLGVRDIIEILLDHGADVNLSARKDGYTPLMLAALANKHDVVRFLLAKGADKTILNCVKRTAADMATFVGLSDMSQIILCWVSFEQTIEPFTRCLELEEQPRLQSMSLAHQLHQFICYPSLHPVRLMNHLKHNTELLQHADPCIFVLEKLAAKYFKSATPDESLSLKFHYFAQLMTTCKTGYENSETYKGTFNDKDFKTFLINYLRRLTKLNEDKTPAKLNEFIYKCIFSYPYNSSTLQAARFAKSKLSKIGIANDSAMAMLTQSIDLCGPRSFGRAEDSCHVCEEGYNNKKCSTCKSVYYCGPDCQIIDWTRHRKVCKSN